MTDLRLASRKMDDLVDLIAKGYRSGARPVRVACKDPGLPLKIAENPRLVTREGTKRLGTRILEMIADAGLPEGELAVERNFSYEKGAPYSYYLVYQPKGRYKRSSR